MIALLKPVYLTKAERARVLYLPKRYYIIAEEGGIYYGK